jgi:hypothetical protein
MYSAKAMVARYRDEQEREHSKHFDRKVDGEK